MLVRGSTLVFRLARPEPRFIEGLAALYPIPQGTPDHVAGSAPVPSTGPYRIETYVPGKLVRLVRNPYFHVWSKAARPDGYPAEIVWRTMAKTTQATTQATKDVLRGKADLVFHAISVREMPSLAASKPRQLHSIRQRATTGVFLNVRRPPFDDGRVRRAFAFAVDRQHMADLHGKQLAEPTCQLVPPNVPGYIRYCPYTIDPSAAGTWTPNLPRARALVRQSGTRGQTVVVWTFRSYEAEGNYVVSVMRKLGYKSQLHYVADTGEYFVQLTQHPKAQAGLLGWFGGTSPRTCSPPSVANRLLGNPASATPASTATSRRSCASNWLIPRLRLRTRRDSTASSSMGLLGSCTHAALGRFHLRAPAQLPGKCVGRPARRPDVGSLAGANHLIRSCWLKRRWLGDQIRKSAPRLTRIVRIRTPSSFVSLARPTGFHTFLRSTSSR